MGVSILFLCFFWTPELTTERFAPQKEAHDSNFFLPRGPKKKPMTLEQFCLEVQKIAHDSKQVLPRGPKKEAHDSKKS